MVSEITQTQLAVAAFEGWDLRVRGILKRIWDSDSYTGGTDEQNLAHSLRRSIFKKLGRSWWAWIVRLRFGLEHVTAAKEKKVPRSQEFFLATDTNVEIDWRGWLAMLLKYVNELFLIALDPVVEISLEDTAGMAWWYWQLDNGSRQIWEDGQKTPTNINQQSSWFRYIPSH
jgi:hypothetical protein